MFRKEYTMSQDNQRMRISRRAFLQRAGLFGGAALLAACGSTAAPSGGAATSAPAAGGEAATSAPAAGGSGQEVSLLWSDTSNARAPLIEDFTKATGIKVNQTIVQYNERLNKIN